MGEHMTPADSQIEQMLTRAAGGDDAACQALLVLHRDRLCRMVAAQLDRRLAARIDPSDVVQDTLLEAAQKLAAYLQQRPVAFYPWLRRIAWERLLKVQEQHMTARKRSAAREERQAPALSDASVLALADRLVAPGTSPSNRVVREELHDRVRTALAGLPEKDREVLVLRYVEQLSFSEIAEVLSTSEGAVKMRHRRALLRVSPLLSRDAGAENKP
jgi:RNA polymerase sigma-70 factor, ECF subfamily